MSNSENDSDDRIDLAPLYIDEPLEGEGEESGYSQIREEKEEEKVVLKVMKVGEKKVIDCGVLEYLRSFNGHSDPINAVVYYPIMQRLISVSDDYMIKVWNIETGECVKTINQEIYINDSMKWDDEMFVTCNHRGEIFVYSVKTYERSKIENKPENEDNEAISQYSYMRFRSELFLRLQKISNEHFVAIQSTTGGSIQMFSFPNRKYVRTVLQHDRYKHDNYTRIRLSDSHKNCLFCNVGDANSQEHVKDLVILFNYETGKIVREFLPGVKSWIYQIGIYVNPQGEEHLIVGAEGLVIYFYNVRSGQCFKSIKRESGLRCFLSTPILVFLGYSDGSLEIFDGANEYESLNFRGSDTDSRYIISGKEEKVGIMISDEGMDYLGIIETELHSIQFVAGCSSGDLKVCKFRSDQYSFRSGSLLEKQDLKERIEYLIDGGENYECMILLLESASLESIPKILFLM